MSVGTWRGVNGVARKVKKQWRGVDNVARKVKKQWRGVDNVARQTFRGNVLFDGGSSGFETAYSGGGYTKTRIESDKAVIYADNNISGSSSMRFELTGIRSTTPISLNGYSKIRVTFCGNSRNIYPNEHWMCVSINDKYENIGNYYRRNILYNCVGGVYSWQSWVDFTFELDVTDVTGEYYIIAGMYTATMKNDGDVMYIKKLELIE
jgi:hypothetical protein